MSTNKPVWQATGAIAGAKSEWAGSSSIRDRIQAMNRTMDLVEEKHRSSTPKSDLLLRFSSSDETFPSSSTEVNPRESGTSDQRTFISRTGSGRSSVIDIWRSRESSSPRIEPPKVTATGSIRSVSPDVKERAPCDEEKKESELTDNANQQRSAREMWNQRISKNQTQPDAVEASVGPASKRVPPSDFTIIPAKEPPSAEPRKSRIAAIWEIRSAEHPAEHATGKPHYPNFAPAHTKPESQVLRRSPPLAPRQVVSDKRPLSRIGTNSPDTSVAGEPVNVKASRLTDMWEKRSRQCGICPDGAPPDDKEHFSTADSRGQSMGKTVDEPTIQQDHQSPRRRGSVVDIWQQKAKLAPADLKADHAQQNQTSGELQRTNGNVLDPEDNKAAKEPIRNQHQDELASCGQISLADRWASRIKGLDGREGKAPPDLDDDATESSSVNTRGSSANRGSLASRWNQRIKELSSTRLVVSQQQRVTPSASTRTSSPSLPQESRHNSFSASVSKLDVDISVAGAESLGLKALDQNSHGQEHERQRKVGSFFARRHDAAQHNAGRSNDDGVSSGPNPSPSSSYRKVAEHWIKVTDNSTCSQAPWVSSQVKSNLKGATQLSNGSIGSLDKSAAGQSSDAQSRMNSALLPAGSGATAVLQKPSNFSLKSYSMKVLESAVRSKGVTMHDAKVIAPTPFEESPAESAVGPADADAADVMDDPSEQENDDGASRERPPSKHQTRSKQKTIETLNLPSAMVFLEGITLQTHDADEGSGNLKPKPTKIIQSWNERVFQTESLPSSPQFSRNPARCSSSISIPSESPKASPGSVCSSRSSAFNAWSGPQNPISHATSPKKGVKVASGRSNRDFVSLGRKHIVQGIAQRGRHDTELGSLNTSDPSTGGGNDVNPSDSANVAQTNTDAVSSSCLVQVSPVLKPSSSPTVEEKAVASKSLPPTRCDPVDLPMVSSTLSGNHLVVPKKPPIARLHLPSPMIRRKKKNPLKLVPTVTPSLSDIVEVHSEDTNGSEPLSPRSRELTMKKKGLQAHRRKLKSGSYDDGKVTPSSENPSLDTNKAEANDVALDELVQAINERVRPSVHDSIDTPLEESKNQVSTTVVRTPTGQSKVSQNPTQVDLHHDSNADARILRPRSPQVSEAEFSFLSDSNSVQSGMTSILSGGSLTNRAEKVLTERKRMQRDSCAQPSKHLHQAKSSSTPSSSKLSGKLLHRTSTHQLVEPSLSLRSSGRSSESSHVQSLDRPRLETRYNKASRFLDATQAHSVRESEHQEPRLQPQGSAEQSCAVESTESSYQSAGSATDESDSKMRPPAKSRRVKKTKKKSVKQRRNDRMPISPSQGVASDKFLAEQAAHFDAFKSAVKDFSFRDIASDWAGEIKMLGFDTQNFATTVNKKLAFCVNETKKAKSCQDFLGFDEEDVAIEVEFMEEDLDEDDSNSIEDDDSTLDEEAMPSRPSNMGMMCSPLGVQAERAQM